MLKKIVSIIIAIISFFISLFSSLFNSGLPQKSDCYVYKNISYGVGTNRTLDLYVPKKASGKCGLILNLHGGTWTDGDKSEVSEETLKYMCEDLGFAAATMNYPFVSKTVDALDILEDIEDALLKIKEKGQETGVTIDRVMLKGVSAGAHLALLYGYTKAISSPIKIACIASFSGPTDLADSKFYSESSTLGSKDSICDLMSKVCGKKFTAKTFNFAVPTLKKVSPLTYVTSVCPPTIIAHGKNDTVVPYSNAMMLNSALGAVGVEHEFIVYSNSGHDLANDPDCEKKANDLLVKYANKYLK